MEPPATPLRIAIVGAESTGKTVLCEHLAKFWNTVWVPEYGRDFTIGLAEKFGGLDSIQWKATDFVDIAKGQLKLEDDQYQKCNRVLFCDSTLLTTFIWSEFLVKTQDEELKRLMEQREQQYDLYILMDIEGVDWIQDGARLAPETKWFQERFLEELKNRKLNYVVVGGRSWTERTSNAEAQVEKYISANLYV